MGLDMYLSASRYVGNWEHSSENEKKTFSEIMKSLGMNNTSCPASPSLTVEISVAYWRKANAIHNWFVVNCQDGEDNCQKYYVGRDQLQELVDTCKTVLKYRDSGDEAEIIEENLPPQAGFFFGSTEINDCYWQDLQDTVEQIESILFNPELNNSESVEFYYQSSW